MRSYLSSTRKVYQDYCTKLEFRPVNESSDEESEVESNEDVTEAYPAVNQTCNLYWDNLVLCLVHFGSVLDSEQN